MPLNLPDRASYEYLRKLAKERLAWLRAGNPQTRLAEAQLAVAREYGFSSWRALKAELDHRRAPNIAAFISACIGGDMQVLSELLQRDASLARERVAGRTGLHLAVRHPDALRLLIEHGADPSARDAGDNASPLHFAAANGSIESVRVLLDAGADVRGVGDLHQGDVIGWAARPGNEEVIALLLARGARHHIFSAMALGNQDLVQGLVEGDPECLSRRRSRFEGGQTAVHASFAAPDGLGFLCGKPDYEMLQLLIELGADIEAADDKGRTPLAVALLGGDREAMRLLKAAGAGEPEIVAAGRAADPIAVLTASIRKSDPMFSVPDMRATVGWYRSLGFAVVDEYEDHGELVFARLSFGTCEFGLSPGGHPGPRDVSLWLYTDRVQDLYRWLKERQLQAARTPPNSDEVAEVRFDEDLFAPFYGGLQFSIRDINGLALVFWQPAWLPAGGERTAERGD